MRLDYEERTVYHLTLLASDGLNLATAQLIIRVLDLNDNAPACFPRTTTVILVENTAYPNFLTITVRDV